MALLGSCSLAEARIIGSIDFDARALETFIDKNKKCIFFELIS
jgi:hypothetical protein